MFALIHLCPAGAIYCALTVTHYCDTASPSGRGGTPSASAALRRTGVVYSALSLRRASLLTESVAVYGDAKSLSTSR